MTCAYKLQVFNVQLVPITLYNYSRELWSECINDTGNTEIEKSVHIPLKVRMMDTVFYIFYCVKALMYTH